MKVELISREAQSAPPKMEADDARWSWDNFNNHYRDLLQIYNRTLNGFIVNTSLVTSSPYTISPNDDDIFVDTDSGDVTVTYPSLSIFEGVDGGKKYRVVNVGTSGNTVLLNPDGSDLLLGENSSFCLFDAEALITTGEETKGWY
jgi:hypothetical protein